MKEPVSTNNAPAAIGPYSQAVKSGGLIFVSGQVPVNPASGTIPESIAEQARQSLSNVQAIVEAAGSSMSKVIRVGIFMTDLADFKTVNEIYASFFPSPHPARATVQVSALPLGAKIEIEAVAEA